MLSTADLIEKQYSEIPYPDGKGDRIKLLRNIASADLGDIEIKVRCAQVIMDVLGDQVALYECLKDDDKSLLLSWVAKNWEESDIEYVELLVAIAINLDSNNVREFLSEKLGKTSNADVKSILEDGLSEI